MTVFSITLIINRFRKWRYRRKMRKFHEACDRGENPPEAPRLHVLPYLFFGGREHRDLNAEIREQKCRDVIERCDKSAKNNHVR